MSKKHIAGLALFFVISLLSSVAYGNNGGGFGPKEMTIKKWRSHLSRHTFDLEQEGDGILEISKNSPLSEIKGGFIFFNKKFIGLRKFFSGEDLKFEKDVSLKSENRLFVFARGKHGASFTLTIRPKDSYTPEIVSFTASPPMIHIGESSTLAWQTNNAETCEIAPGVGIVDCNASTSVEPLMPTTYTLTAIGWGQTITATVTVEILNSAPVADAQEVTTDEDTDLPITLSGSDADDDALTFEVHSQPLYGTLAGDAPNLIYTPNENFDKSDSFEFVVNDGELDSEPALVAITVTPVNDAPIAHAQTVSLNEDESKAIVLSATEVDDEDELTYEIISEPNSGILDGSPPNMTYTPAANYYGPDSFEFKVSDGIADPSSALITIVVNPVNDTPVAADDTAATGEDNPVVINVLANDEDVDGDALSVSDYTQPVYGTVDDHGDGTFTYTPFLNYYGNDSFSYTLSDGAGGTDAAVVNIIINPINDAPVAKGQSPELDEDETISIVLSVSDAENDDLTYEITGPSQGTLSGTAPNLTYTPGADYYGMDEFTFTASDGQLTSNTATVTLIIFAVNDAPVAEGKTVELDEDQTYNIVLSATDVEDDPLTYAVSSEPSYGTLSGTAPNLTYTPNADYNGPDSFTFTANDGDLTSSSATVNFIIYAVNDAPVASDNSVMLDEDKAAFADLIAWDVDNDLSELTYEIVVGPAHGELSGTAPNLIFTPVDDYNGSDTFTFTASDGPLTSNVATVTLLINAVNDAPVANAGSDQTVSRLDTVTLDGSGSKDVDGDELSFRWRFTSRPSGSTAVLSGSSSVGPSFIADLTGDYEIELIVKDELIDSEPDLVTITANPRMVTVPDVRNLKQAVAESVIIAADRAQRNGAHESCHPSGSIRGSRTGGGFCG
jgi:hypothetical protein